MRPNALGGAFGLIIKTPTNHTKESLYIRARIRPSCRKRLDVRILEGPLYFPPRRDKQHLLGTCFRRHTGQPVLSLIHVPGRCCDGNPIEVTHNPDCQAGPPMSVLIRSFIPDLAARIVVQSCKLYALVWTTGRLHIQMP